MADQNEFDAAIETAKAAPDDMEAWDRVETIAGELDQPDEVAAAFDEVLSRDLEAALIESLGERAANFHEEWYGDSSPRLAKVLSRVMQVAPGAVWAFQRLTVAFTVTQQWDALLAVYDSALDAEKDEGRRSQLLDEAAQVAKDVAGQPDKAIGYLQQLIPLKPKNKKLVTSLQRLLERHERWTDLIGLWSSRLETLKGKQRAASRLRIATCWLENLKDPANALEALRPLLAEAEDDTEARALLERILTDESADPDVRRGALDTLRSHFEETKRPREVVRVLELALELAEDTRAQELHEEAGELLADLGDDTAAMKHYAALLAKDPSSAVTQEQMRSIAQRTEDYSGYADGVAAAAANAKTITRRVALLSEAARTKLDILDDVEGAIELYKSSLDAEGVSDKDVRMVARRLSDLLAGAERPRERLDVLQRLWTVEKTAASRRAVMGETARLAEVLAETDIALQAWGACLATNPDDVDALDATIALLERNERWELLIGALSQRIEKERTGMRKRASMVRVAIVAGEELGDIEQAIDAWRRVAGEFGENSETIEALAELLGKAERWQEQATLLQRASVEGTARVTGRLMRLADAQREHLGEPELALGAYSTILRLDPVHERARAGLTALLDSETCRATAAKGLAGAYRRTKDWPSFLELVEPRLADADDPVARLDILREAADIQELQTGDAAGALAALARALPLAPANRMLADRVARLAASTGQWAVAVGAYRDAADAAAEQPHDVAQLRFVEARALETELDDAEGAHAAYTAVITIDPNNVAATRSAVQLGAQLGKWDEVARAIVALSVARESFEEDLLDHAEGAAAEADAIATLAAAIATAVDASDALPRRIGGAFFRRVAVWHRDRLEDTAAAKAALVRALKGDSSHQGSLRDLATLQRETPDKEFYATLQRLIDADPAGLDLLHEAANVAIGLDDAALMDASITALFSRASATWRGTAEGHGSQPPQELVGWALEQLVQLRIAGGQAAGAVDVLIDAARLPFDADGKRTLRLRAAEIAGEQLEDTNTAIEMYRSVLTAEPGDTETMQRLGALYDADERFAELLNLRKIELSLDPDPERRLALRLELVRLVAEISRRGAPLDALRTNLDESPGHEASIEALAALLEQQSKYAELGDVLEAQASKLEGLEQTERAAALFGRAALLCETHLADRERAIRTYKRVVALAPSPDTFEALARLYVELEQPANAVPWLRKMLSTAPAERKQDVAVQLATAHVGAGGTAEAIDCLAANITDDDAAPKLRSMLLDLYRTTGAEQELAEFLTRSVPFQADKNVAIAYANEAAELYEQLGTPDKAIPAIEAALDVAPSDRALRLRLATGLRVAGHFDRAKDILSTLIEEFGRRRSAERAAVHVEFAMVAKSEGEPEEALKHIEAAAKMDASNPRVLWMTAKMAHENGNTNEAERRYRALLLVVRRHPPGDDAHGVGASEVLFELHKITAAQGDEEQAAEQLESALEAAAQSDAEVRRLRRSLIAHGDFELLLKALRSRLEASEDSKSQADLQSDIAEVLDSRLERPSDALDAMLGALRLVPDRIEYHDASRTLAGKASDTARYVDCVVETVEQLRRKQDGPLVADLLMKAGTAAEQDAEDLDRAAEIYRLVEATGERTAEALFALARVAGASGDADEQNRTLDALLQLATTGETSADQVDALYRLSEYFVKNDERRDQGIELLRQAFEAEPRYAQAGETLRNAAELAPDHEAARTLYETVARGSGDWQMLLDFLERRARSAGATPDQIKEAVDVANENDQRERGEALLATAVDAARDSGEGIASAVWAVLALAKQKAMAGDVAAARDLLFEVAHLVEHERLMELGLAIAQKAADDEASRPLAAELYEFLRERDPGARSVWEPLVSLYRAMGDGDRLQNIISVTLPSLVDPAERNALRMQHATYLIEELSQREQAVEVLRDLLLDDPDHLEGAAMLEQVLRDSGDKEGLADFLWQRFEDAKERRNPDTITDVARRLGSLLEQMESDEAVSVYRAALEIAPESRELLAAVLANLREEAESSERAALMERLLAVESAEAAPALADKLAAMRESMEDDAGVQRALELGHRAAPEDHQLHNRLESWYRDRQLWNELALLMFSDAERLAEDQPAIAVTRLREAASVYRESMEDPRKATSALQRARLIAPSNESLVTELAVCLRASGEHRQAVHVITEALEGSIEGGSRIEPLLARSELHLELGEAGPALVDAEEAYGLDNEGVHARLLAVLEQVRTRAEGAHERDLERTATLRLAQLLATAGETERARDLLSGWVEREPRDGEPLHLLRDMDLAAENWEGVITACSRLVVIEEGEGQIAAALALANAAEKAERPDAARRGLEMVHGAQPESSVVRDQLRRIYELSGAHRELALLLLSDGDHGDDVDARFDAYRRAAEVFLFQLGDAAAAAEPAMKARELKPDDHHATVTYVDVLIGSGKTAEATEILEPAIATHKRRSPELAMLQQRMARAAAVAGDKDGQLTWLRKSFDVDRKNGEIAAELAHLATEVGDYDLALKPLRAITLMDDPGPITRVMALLWEAKIEHARGNRAKAELWAKKALREDPNFAEAQEFLSEISD